MSSVCIVTPDLAGPTRNGGIGTHCLHLGRHLARQGLAVTILHTGVPDDPDRERWRRIYREEHNLTLLLLDEIPDDPPYPILPHTDRHRISHRVYRWLRSQDFTTVFFQDWQGNGAISVRARHTGLAFANTRLVVTTHGPSEWIRSGMREFPSEGRESLIDDMLERTAVELADVVVSPSRYLIDWLSTNDWRLPADVRVVPYVFESGVAGSAPRGLAPGELEEIVFFGRLETRKGLEPFLGALELLAASGPGERKLRVELVGKPHIAAGGAADALIARTAEAVKSRFEVNVHREWNHTEALAWLAKRERALVVMPSLDDNAPFAVLECLAIGQPLLASRRGGIPEIVRSEAHLIEPTAHALAASFANVLSHGLPPCPSSDTQATAAASWSELARAADLDKGATPNPPRISVCIPHFNHVTALAETLTALAGQSVAPAEVIVVDDGSDESQQSALAALESRYAGHPGWQFLRRKNAGPAAARNAAAAQASGEALLFCDADNRPDPRMLEHLGRALVASQAPIVVCAFTAHRVSTDGEWNPAPDYLFCPFGDAAEAALLENFAGDANLLVRADIFRDLGGFDPDNRAASEDWEFLLKAGYHGCSIAVVPEACFAYRLDAASHARRHSETESAETAWRVMPEAERRRYLRLLRSARGTFVARTSLVQHAATLQRTLNLRTERIAALELRAQLTEQHAANLEQSLANARENTSRLYASLAESVDSTTRLNQELQRLSRDYAAVVANLEHLVRLREGKIDRMQRSLSWRVTAPLRAVRRAMFDAKTDSPPSTNGNGEASAEVSSPEIERGATPVAPGYLCCVDFPKLWQHMRARQFAIRGWLLCADGGRIEKIRARNGAEIFPGRCRLFRADVRSDQPEHPEAANSGFEIDVRASGTVGRFAIEVLRQGGNWECVFDTIWSIAANATETAADLYLKWIDTQEDFSPIGRQHLRDEINEWPERPLVSVIMPVFNTPVRWLGAAIESVRSQIYSDWELCIADDASTNAEIPLVLQEFARMDSRIKVVRRQENGHISLASNSALELAQGAWVTFLDHDDVLAPDALAEVVRAALLNPDAELIYSDEDKIDEAGRRFSPYFKPDWLPDLLLGQNFVSHLAAYRLTRVRALGGFRTGFEGSQDWDLALRVTETVAAHTIVHVPKVLYHWRAIPGSTAIEVNQKTYSVDSARRAIAEHFERRREQAEMVEVPGHNWRVRRALVRKPLVSLIIPTRDKLELVRRCVESIEAKTDYLNFEIVVVDNQSREPETLAWFQSLANRPVRVLPYPHPFNFSAINNFAAGQVRGEILGFLNNDLEALHADWLDEMVSHVVRPDVGGVGAMLYYPDGTVQHAGVVLGVGGVANHAFLRFVRGSDGYFNRLRVVQNYSAVTGACLLVRRQVFEQVGGFNAQDLPVAFNDVDFCLRVRAAGYLNVWTPFAEFIHHESASRGIDDTAEKQARFVREIEYMRRTWGPLLDDDPAYSPHLSLEYPDFSIASPPRKVTAHRPSARPPAEPLQPSIRG